MNRSILIGLFLACLSGCGNDSPIAPVNPIGTTTPATERWITYHSTPGRFSVLVPHQPQSSIQEVDTALEPITISIFQTNSQNGERFHFTFADYPPGPDYQNSVRAESILTSVLGGNLSAHHAESAEQRNFDIDQGFGREAEFDKDGQHMWIRVMLSDNRLYQIMATWPMEGDSATVEKVFASFSIVPEEK